MSKTVTVLDNWVRTRKAILLPLLVIALGSFLRIYGLGAENIWCDEAHSINVSSQTIISTITGAASGQHPPLYFVILTYSRSGPSSTTPSPKHRIKVFQDTPSMIFHISSHSCFHDK